MTNGLQCRDPPYGENEDDEDPIGPVGRFGSGFGYRFKVRWVLGPIGFRENCSLVTKRTMDSVTTFQTTLACSPGYQYNRRRWEQAWRQLTWKAFELTSRELYLTGDRYSTKVPLLRMCWITLIPGQERWRIRSWCLGSPMIPGTQC